MREALVCAVAQLVFARDLRAVAALFGEHLPYISPISPLDLPCISPVSPLYLRAVGALFGAPVQLDPRHRAPTLPRAIVPSPTPNIVPTLATTLAPARTLPTRTLPALTLIPPLTR